MTNREVYVEIEGILARHYPFRKGGDDLHQDIIRCVDIVIFELNINKNMAINYVRNIATAYSPHVEDVTIS